MHKTIWQSLGILPIDIPHRVCYNIYEIKERRKTMLADVLGIMLAVYLAIKIIDGLQEQVDKYNKKK